jgi:hypothetical protein
LFLPDKLADHFRLIHQMESSLRDLLSRHPVGHFEGIYLVDPLQPTRRNVLEPGSIGMYVAGSYCNPRYPLRAQRMRPNTDAMDIRLEPYPAAEPHAVVTVDFILELLEFCKEVDPDEARELWNPRMICMALEKLRHLFGNRAYLVVKRDRDLRAPREETQGFLSGGEEADAPKDAPTLFAYRLRGVRKPGDIPVWWPLIRFPEGKRPYAIAFSLER